MFHSEKHRLRLDALRSRTGELRRGGASSTSIGSSSVARPFAWPLPYPLEYGLSDVESGRYILGIETRAIMKYSSQWPSAQATMAAAMCKPHLGTTYIDMMKFVR